MIPATMAAVLLTGHGGYEALDYRTDVPVPQPKAGEVLIRVAAAAVNNTDINTRTAWYSKAVTEGSNAGGPGGFAGADDGDASWSGVPLHFPRIQGADACGRIVAVGEGVSPGRIGERVIDRDADLVAALDRDSVDVVLDLVGGAGWPQILEVLRRGGRYVISGAIAGPMAELDLRTLYLKDLTLYGATFQEDEVFENLVSYIEAGRIRPVVAKTYPLKDIVQAQKDFLAKGHVGKLVLIPPADEA